MNVQIRRGIIIASMAVIVLASLLYGFWPKAASVETAVAERGPFTVTIEEEGKTRVKERFIVSSPVAGFMRRVELQAGDTVTKGDPVFLLDPLPSQVLDPRSRAEAASAVSAAKASVRAAEEGEESAKAGAELALKQLTRYKHLMLQNAVSRELYDQKEAQAKSAQASYLAAQAATHVARADLERAQSVLRYSGVRSSAGKCEPVVVRSPKSGQVLKLYRESEGAVNMGEPIIEIGDATDIEVRVELLSADAVKIGKGTKVTFEHWGGDHILTGRVRTVEPSGFTKISSLGVEEQRVLVTIDIASKPNDRPNLGDGYRIEARFVVWEGQNVLHVPASALFREGEKWALFKVDGGRARRRIVEVGHQNGLRAQILKGLAEGDRVITRPDDKVHDGGRVHVRKIADQ